MVPVGDGVIGRVVDVLGRPIDGKGEIKAERYMPIHRKAPTLDEQFPATEIFETGIKVIDLLVPYAKGGKIGLFGGAGVGKTVLIMELTTMSRRITEDTASSPVSAREAARESSLSGDDGFRSYR